MRKQVGAIPARVAFERSEPAEGYLSPALLPVLQARFVRPTSTDYSPGVRTSIGRSRAEQLLGELQAPVRSVLELGCGDGRLCGALRAAGVMATGVDRRADLFDPAAIRAGARLVEMDAHELDFGDNEFDAVVSHGAFEHFEHPDRVLEEALRVTAPGGLITLSFGPLYLAPKGLHAYRTINVPYCQILFGRPVLDAFVAKLGASPIAWSSLNGWSVSAFRDLFRTAPRARATVISYVEHTDISGSGLIREFPGFFKAKSSCFDDFLVASIRTLLRKN